MLLLIAAAFTLKAASGGTETLFPVKDRRATVVYVVLAECPNARAYSPEIAKIAREYEKKGVRCLMAFYDAKSGQMKTQMKEFGLRFPAVHADARLIRMIGAKAVPTAAIISPDGKMAYVGRIDDRFPALGVRRKPRRSDLRLALDAFLAGRKVATARTEVIGCLLPNG